MSRVERYLTIKEVSELLRVPQQTIYNWRTRHYGPPATKVGQQLRYSVTALEAWLAAQADEWSK